MIPSLYAQRRGATLDQSVTCAEKGTAFTKREAVSVERQVQESRPVTEQPPFSQEEKLAFQSLEKLSVL